MAITSALRWLRQKAWAFGPACGAQCDPVSSPKLLMTYHKLYFKMQKRVLRIKQKCKEVEVILFIIFLFFFFLLPLVYPHRLPWKPASKQQSEQATEARWQGSNARPEDYLLYSRIKGQFRKWMHFSGPTPNLLLSHIQVSKRYSKAVSRFVWKYKSAMCVMSWDNSSVIYHFLEIEISRNRDLNKKERTPPRNK